MVTRAFRAASTQSVEVKETGELSFDRPYCIPVTLLVVNGWIRLAALQAFVADIITNSEWLIGQPV